LIYSEGETFEDLLKNIDLEEFKEEAESEKTFKMHVDARGRLAR
jgi:cytidylate kinase